MNAEQIRLEEARQKKRAWKKWGPYLSDRQWGTVCEDYSEDGDAWNYFTHDQARSRAYRWGEDGIAGISDNNQHLCFALALWNGKDPILKERLFGVTHIEGNHGADVKEYYFHLDSTPTHSYMKYLYKYPHAAYPYADLVETNRRRTRHDMEYELIDTGIFDDDRYFDVFVEYAKNGPDDILMRITAANRGPDAAELHLLPTLWFRNDWGRRARSDRSREKPAIRRIEAAAGESAVTAAHPELGEFILSCEGEVPLLFTDNVTNCARLSPGSINTAPYVKDGIHDYVIHNDCSSINPAGQGTKAAAHYQLKVEPGQSATVRLRLVADSASSLSIFGSEFDEVFSWRIHEADEFYASVIPPSATAEAAAVMRQAIAGILWNKQFYYFDSAQWLEEHRAHMHKAGSRDFRNREWFHMLSKEVICTPDKWEYPWYAAWDLAFHTLPLSLVDVDFAKEQLQRMLRGVYVHSNGQPAANEWNFSDVNPPVHAFATLFLHRTLQAANGETDVDFLKSAFDKLAINFTWWVNRKDRTGKHVFDGGFLGLDNIGVFDRSAPLPNGGHLEQTDSTAWMALFSQNMLELALELVPYDPAYEEMASTFFEHFIHIAGAMNRSDEHGMWDEEDGFYYDRLRFPDGSSTKLKARSLVGLLPLCATTIVADPGHGANERSIIALVNEERLRRILARMLDENEFLSPYGIRSLSKVHEKNPYVFNLENREYHVGYFPAESDSGMFGGNSNWRGPVWMPINIMLIRALQNYYLYYGDAFQIECPTGSGRMMNLFDVSKEIAERLNRVFLRNEQGRRPIYGGAGKFQTDPYWRDHILFYEYFHGDNGAGLGASHQTGWALSLVTNDAELQSPVAQFCSAKRDFRFDRESQFAPNHSSSLETNAEIRAVAILPIRP
jgi:hypothetical protein